MQGPGGTSSAPPTPPQPGWAAEWRGALAGAAAVLPLMFSLGLLAFAAAGPARAQLGMPGALATVLLGGLALATLGRTMLPAAGPSSATTLIFAGVVAQIAADPALDLHRSPDVAALAALTGTLVLGMAAGLALLGLLRLGSLARYVPRPVLAGFMNGVALLIVVAQWPVLSGMARGALGAEGWAALHRLQPWLALLGLGTAALAFLVARLWPRAPALLVALVAGGLLVPFMADGLSMPLATVGTLPTPWPLPLALQPLAQSDVAALWWRHAPALALGALLLALVGGLESMLNLLAMEAVHGQRANPDRELLALGGANLLSGLCGGLPVVHLRLFANAVHQAGGRSRRATLAAAWLLTATLLLAAPWLAWLPLVVLAGVMLVVAAALVDRWSLQLAAQWQAGMRTAELYQSLAIMAAVCAVTVALGFVWAVAVGVVLAMLLFTRSMNRSLLRASFSAELQPSRRVYTSAQEAWLAPRREHIRVFELEGALFFGSAERLAEEAERLPPGTTALVADLRRVSTLDASGAVQLMLLADRLAQRGVALRLAGVTADNRHGQALKDYGAWRPALAFIDTDHAVEAAEQALLAQAGRALEAQSLSLAQCALAEGLNSGQLARLQAHVTERRLAPGEWLFREGDPGDRLYLVAEGSISVTGALGQRFVSFSPGMTLGETAVLDGKGRTAGGRADVASRVYELTATALEALRSEDPELAAEIFRNLARHLSERLRSAAEAWRRAAG